MPVTLRGTSTPARQRLTEHWSPTNGYSAEYEYRGFNEALIRAKAAQWQNSGIEHDLTNALGIYTLRGTDTSGQATIDTWEIGVNKITPHILENPVTLAGIMDDPQYDESHLMVLKNQAKGIRTPEQVAIICELNAAALRCSDRMAKGSEAYGRSGYVLRHTTNVSSRYGVNVSDTNIDRIYTTPQLLTEAGNANSWVFPLPGRLAYKVQQLDAQLQANYVALDFHTWGWVKRASPESTAANNRVNILTEYEFDQWSEDVYLLV
jgi:hypothetical protein